MNGVFVSVGSMMPFDRLVQAMDEWAAAHPDVPVEIQIGRGKYEPRHAKYVRMMPVVEYRQRVADARLFVAHAGMGSIISAIEAGKPLLMLARLQAQGEHNTDHQLATAASIGARPGLHVAGDVADLKARATVLLADAGAPPAPISRFADPKFTDRIRAFIEAA
ncbi:glycosyltransferase [Polymorphobacter fuscus]|uniref:glycosyltransferase n=1 Tax=Sandarakinorhabdus fusca TaxID=1439888 RepID=UPI0016AD64C1|nr:glycosyltransferase [Polymorphobacter fuscus]NJC09226.1 UDP-N-acetylglucosamine transferase subunit ALG13 [Polymorphobacter fuscus]